MTTDAEATGTTESVGNKPVVYDLAPIRKIIGDLSDTDRVLVGLQLRPHGENPS